MTRYVMEHAAIQSYSRVSALFRKSLPRTCGNRFAAEHAPTALTLRQIANVIFSLAKGATAPTCVSQSGTD
jgi:hypothetical protein